ncbi:MAG: hypothetical protein WCI87_04875 [Euryarchaeota archaeon]
MITLERARELFGELPKEVEEDSYYQVHFLSIYSHSVKDRGEKISSLDLGNSIKEWTSV